jgi:hypothetical protein
MVELNPGFADDGEASAVKPEAAVNAAFGGAPSGGSVGSFAGSAAGAVEYAGTNSNATPGVADFAAPAAPASPQGGTPGQSAEDDSAPLSQIGDNAEGVRLAGQLLAAATTARWPMYLRNVKQILRAGGFDERRYGFGGLIDLLRGCQRDGFVRMERDRRGGLRVFQGTAIRPATTQMSPGQTASAVRLPQPDVEDELKAEGDSEGDVDIPVERVEAIIEVESTDADIIEIAPVSVVDTTAELLGRAKPRRPRTRAAGAPGSGVGGPPTSRPAPARGGRTAATGGRKTAAKKPAASTRRTTTTSRGKKSSDGDDENRGNR